MQVEEKIKELLLKEKISISAPIPLADCTVVKPYLLEREGISDGTAFMFAIPYFSPEAAGEHNVSAYCAPRDYHGFCDELAKKILPELKAEFPNDRFALFSDKSPIDERDAAARAGIGIIGQNGMLITEKYSSYVFLGEIVTSISIPCSAKAPEYCENCGVCKKHCPMDKLGNCLSAITQKKGELTGSERSALLEYNTAWGCDICQKVCPHTLKALKNKTIFTDIPYFLENITPDLTIGLLNAMSDREFAARAYSWRGRATVMRNLEILGEEKNSKK